MHMLISTGHCSTGRHAILPSLCTDVSTLPEEMKGRMADLKRSALESVKRIDIWTELNQPLCDLVAPLAGCQVPVEHRRHSYSVTGTERVSAQPYDPKCKLHDENCALSAALIAFAAVIGWEGNSQRCSFVIVTAVCVRHLQRTSFQEGEHSASSAANASCKENTYLELP